MKNYKVIITRNFFDNEEKIDRILGTNTEEFMCTKERYEFLKSKNNAVELIEVIDEKWAVTEEDDEKVHVRPVINNEIIDTSVEEVVNEIVEEQEDEETENDEEAEEKTKKRTSKK